MGRRITKAVAAARLQGGMSGHPPPTWPRCCGSRCGAPPTPGRTAWGAFLRAHAGAVWARDFLPVTDLFFRQVFAFFMVELASRRVIHVGVTRHSTDAWVA